MLVLESNVNPLKAAEILSERGPGSAENAYELTLLATGDKAAADDAWTRFVDSELRAGRTPEV